MTKWMFGVLAALSVALFVYPYVIYPLFTQSTTLTTDATSSEVGYVSTVSPIYTPGELHWAGRKWRVNSAATKHAGIDYAIQRSQSWAKLRFEVRRTDPQMSSNPEKRRSELSGSVYGDKTRLPNGVSLWGAFSTNHHPWADSEGMKATWGGVYGQIHMGSKVGGSPALAFRRHQGGNLRITTRGEFDDGGTERYDAPLAFGKVHDIVYNVVLHPTAGRLRVWVDGAKLVDDSNISIGHSAADSYWKIGLYFPKNVTSPAVAEYANHIYPSSESLLDRVSLPPAWPAN